MMLRIEMRVKGQINQQWADWFSGLAISHPTQGETALTGRVPDEAALYGIIARLRDLGLQLTSLRSEEISEEDIINR